MRLPNLESFNNTNKIERRSLPQVPRIDRHVVVMSDKDKLRVIKQIERIVRSSIEYREYISFLKREIDMTKCAFFNNMSNKDGRKVSLEIHHEPFTLFDITRIVLEKWMESGKVVNVMLIAEEIMKLHYQNKVGLIPVSVTVHQLIHSGKVFVPLQNVYGDFISFFDEYAPFVGNEIEDKLEEKLADSQDLTKQDTSILGTKYVYLEIEGFNLPQIVEDKTPAVMLKE